MSQIVTLTEPTTGLQASILASQGFNCFSLTVPDASGPFELLWAPPTFGQGQDRPSSGGIPLLFPFPGRVCGQQFVWQGQTYTLTGGDAHGNAIHGFVLSRPWEVIEQTGTRVVGKFHASKVDPTLLDCWPTDFILTVSYEVRGHELRSEIKVENPTDEPLPWGLGTHPYFRVPLAANGVADDCQVTVPANNYWELEKMLPTGRIFPAAGSHGLQHTMAFANCKFDDVFDGLKFVEGRCRSTILDPTVGRTVAIEFDDQFRAAVVYTPGHREAICIEPYTCIPDPVNLASRGIDAGFKVLPAGGTASLEIVIRVE